MWAWRNQKGPEFLEQKSNSLHAVHPTIHSTLGVWDIRLPYVYEVSHLHVLSSLFLLLIIYPLSPFGSLRTRLPKHICVQNEYLYPHQHTQTNTHTHTHRHVDLARRHHTHRLQLCCFSSWLYLTQSSRGRRRAETEARQHQMKMAALLQAAAEGRLTSDRETSNMRWGGCGVCYQINGNSKSASLYTSIVFFVN